MRFDFWKEVDKFNVGGQKQLACWNAAQVKLGMKQLELNHWTEKQYIQ